MKVATSLITTPEQTHLAVQEWSDNWPNEVGSRRKTTCHPRYNCPRSFCRAVSDVIAYFVFHITYSSSSEHNNELSAAKVTSLLKKKEFSKSSCRSVLYDEMTTFRCSTHAHLEYSRIVHAKADEKEHRENTLVVLMACARHGSVRDIADGYALCSSIGLTTWCLIKCNPYSLSPYSSSCIEADVSIVYMNRARIYKRTSQKP